MTTRTALLEFIRNGENSGVEFKRDTIESRVFVQELVALSNLEGGAVLLGVEDDGGICGVSRPDLESWVMTACRTKMRPEVIPFFVLTAAWNTHDPSSRRSRIGGGAGVG